MQKGDYLTTILKSPKTVFTSKDIAILWQDSGTPATWVRIGYYVKKGDLIRLRNGLYAKSEDYNKLELATRIFTPSYISFETVLAKEGLIFQMHEPIFVASYTTRKLTVDGQEYSFCKIKDEVLSNALGVKNNDEMSIASKERAFLDTLYINNDYYFDNLRSLDWNKVFQILPIYNNQRMAKKVHLLVKSL